MIPYIILLSLFSMILALENSCKNCKYYINSIDNNPNLGLCKVFKDTHYLDKDIVIHNFAIHCRNNENLCGKEGFFYEDRTTFYNLNKEYYSDINNKDELEQLEREMFDVLQRMKKYNTKRIYNTTKELYNLFKIINKHS
jgi:hypothetical protein